MRLKGLFCFFIASACILNVQARDLESRDNADEIQREATELINQLGTIAHEGENDLVRANAYRALRKLSSAIGNQDLIKNTKPEITSLTIQNSFLTVEPIGFPSEWGYMSIEQGVIMGRGRYASCAIVAKSGTQKTVQVGVGSRLKIRDMRIKTPVWNVGYTDLFVESDDVDYIRCYHSSDNSPMQISRMLVHLGKWFVLE